MLLLAACFLPSAKEEDVGWFILSPDDSLSFVRRLSPRAPECPDTPITVAVHGYFGAGPEWAQSLPYLQGTTWFYKWSPYQPADEVLAGLLQGLDLLATCGQPIQAIGHSAGGILLSMDVSRLQPPTVPFTVFTVASPLGGVGGRSPNLDPSLPLASHMGERILGYPPPVAGVRIVHLRTSPQKDWFSRVHEGNDPLAVSVPGAALVDVPPELGHDASLPWATARIADGSWTSWFPP